MSDPWISTYAQQHPRAQVIFDEARQLIAGGVGHDLRFSPVAPTYITHAKGSRKWDVDGKEYVDFGMGNAALLLGHAPDAVVEAIRAVVGDGFHFGNDHPRMVEWARLICQLIPSAERVRFVNSGTEGSMLALRLARAFTGKPNVLRLEGHFSGWHDWVGRGAAPPFDRAVSVGIPTATLETIVVVPARLEAVEAALRRGDIGAVMIEPSGASWATVPLTVEFNRGLRELTRQHNTPLIYDEVISGFRYSPGGYQQLIGVTPDLTVLGKVVTGGMPGAAVAGRADIMRLFEYTDDPEHNRFRRVSHQGTFNANPLSAAAAVATLNIAATGEPQAHANTMAERLRDGMEAILEAEGAAGYVYGDASIWHCYLVTGATEATTRRELRTDDAAALKSIPGQVVTAFQKNLQLRGVDVLSYTGGVTSAAHTAADIDHTLGAFKATIQALLEAGLVARLARAAHPVTARVAG